MCVAQWSEFSRFCLKKNKPKEEKVFFYFPLNVAYFDLVQAMSYGGLIYCASVGTELLLSVIHKDLTQCLKPSDR